MKELYKHLTETPMFNNVEMNEENDILISTGLVYSDQSNIDFEIIRRNDSKIMTDNGRTLAFLDKVFELTEPDVIKNIKGVTELYKVGMKKQRMVLELGSIDDFTEEYLKLLYCADFTDSMRMFYV